MKKLILFALCACISMGAGAAKKNSKKKKQQEPVEVATRSPASLLVSASTPSRRWGFRVAAVV